MKIPGRRTKPDAGDGKDPKADDTAWDVARQDAARTLARSVGRYGRQNEPFSIILLRIEQVIKANQPVDIGDDEFLTYLRQKLRPEDDVYTVSGRTFVIFVAGADLAKAQLAGYRLGTALSGRELRTPSGEVAYVTFDYGIAEWAPEVAGLEGLVADARQDLRARRASRPSRLEPGADAA